MDMAINGENGLIRRKMTNIVQGWGNDGSMQTGYSMGLEGKEF